MRPATDASPSIFDAMASVLHGVAPDDEGRQAIAMGLRLVADQLEASRPATEGESRFESTTDAAARLALSPKTVERMCRCGRLEGAQKFGSVWRVPTDAVPARAVSENASVRPVAGGQRRKTVGSSQSQKSAAESAILGPIRGKVAGAKPTRSGPGDAPTSRSPVQRSQDPMNTPQGTPAVNAATVTRIHDGGAR